MARSLIDLAGAIRGFIEKNPTPAGFVQKASQPVVQRTQSFLQRFPSPASYVKSVEPPRRSIMNVPVVPMIPQTSLRNLSSVSRSVGQGLQRVNIPTLPISPPFKAGIPALQLPEQINMAAQSYGRTLANPMGDPLESAMNIIPFMGRTKAVTQPIKSEAQQRLKNLLTYADDMKRMGYGIPGGRGAIPDVKTGIKILAKEMPQYYNKQAIDEALIKEAGMEGANWITKTFKPLKGLTPDLQDAITSHVKKINVARINADELARSFETKLDPKLEWKLVQWSQNPTAEMADALKLSSDDLAKGIDVIEKSRLFNDEIFNKARFNGIDLDYLKNHIYQIFKESPDKVDDILQAKGLGRKPGFAQHRAIPNFMEAQKLGLTPKFTTFAQLNAAAQEALEKSLANNELAKKLKQSGQLLPQSQAPANWEKITARWFPKANVRIGRTNSMQQDWYAPRQVADVLNNYFGGQKMSTGDKVLNTAADISGKMQNVALSGGIGPLNFFGVGQLIKEFTAGRVLTPVKSFARAFSGSASKNYQTANKELIREMASEGINIRGIDTYQKMYRNVTDNPKITEVLGDLWHKAIDEPTFGRFMNDLQIGFYKDTKTALLQKGLSDRIAQQTAAEATKVFYGLTNNIGRSQGVQDVLTTVFLAPKYREGMLNIFSNLVQSVLPKNIRKVEYNAMRKLGAGLALSYAGFNAAQFRLTGNYMWDNPPGKEFELVIPVGDPKDKKFISIPWMPGFTALPRRVVSGAWAMAKGDPKEGFRQWGSLLSIPLGRAFELIANKDYWGNEIYSPAGERKINLFGQGEIPYQGNEATDLALYAGKQMSPGYVRAGIDYLTGKSTPAFAAVQALELPVRKGSFPNPYWEAMDKAKETLTKEEKTQFDQMNLADSKGGLSTQEEARLMLENPRILEARRIVKLGSNPNDPLWTRPTRDIEAYLAYQMATDTTQKAKLRQAFPWIPGVQFASSQAYFESVMGKVNPTAGYDPNSLQGRLGTMLNPAKPYTGKIPEQPTASPMQQLTPEQVAIASSYTAAPKGSAMRRAILANNPWLKGYWEANNQYYAENPFTPTGTLTKYLSGIGIDPNTQSSFGYAPFKKSLPKIKIRKTKMPKMTKIKMSKPVTIKIRKLPKQKNITIRRNTFATRPAMFGAFRRIL